MEKKTVLEVSGKYYLPGDQLMSFAHKEGVLSVVRAEEINNKKHYYSGHNLSSCTKSLKEKPLGLLGKIVS